MKLLYFLALIAVQDIPENQLVTQVDGKDVYPLSFRGRWAKSLAGCSSEGQDLFEIGETRIRGYEFDSILLKSTPVILEGVTLEKSAYTIVVLAAFRAEDNVEISKGRLSLFEGKLYMSNAEAVSEEQHLRAEYANVRCP